jgi:hypothetical protein
MLDDGPATSGSLLDRLHTWSDRSAWQRFFTNYNSSPRSLTRPRLHNPADAQELVQILWCELARRLRSFRYNPRQSFRGWLRCLHTCRLSDFRKAERRRFAREHQYTTEAEPPAIHHITTAASDTPNALAANSRWNAQAGFRPQFANVSVQSRGIFFMTWPSSDSNSPKQPTATTCATHQPWAAFSRVHRMLQQEATREDSA